VTVSQIERGDTHHEVLVWIVARNRVTQAEEAAGFWSGGENRSFLVQGSVRAYFGIGAVIDAPPILARVGGVAQVHQVILAANGPEVEAALRGYDPRLGRIEIHVVRFDPQTGAELGIDRLYRGRVDKAPREIPAKGGDGDVWSIEVVSGMRALTRPLTLKRSDASQRARLLPDGRPDAFFRYADVAGAVERFHGMERAT
jgi:hypothetical protein